MSFDDLLKNLWGYDCEVTSHDTLMVFINYITKERVYFHNCDSQSLQNFIDIRNPILMGFNCNNYDKWILKCWLSGYTPEEIKEVSDFIIKGGKGWEAVQCYMNIPIMWDLFNEINPRKSLKEIEGNLRLDITESTVDFNIRTQWTKEEFNEMLYYCTCDVEALFPLFDKLKNGYKSKYIIAKFGNIEPSYALSQTNANLTAILLKAERQTYDDNFKYTYPDCIDKSKIPKEALDYFDDIIEHNDLEYSPIAPELELKDILFQIGIGGGHAFKKQGTYYYDRNKSKKRLCNWDFTSLYPNLVRLFGYSSRSQSNKDGYVDVLDTRMKAKKGLLTNDFLSPMGLTNKDLNIGLKLPLNAYTGGLRAKFNKLYDNLQGFSICTTGQLIILQLIHDLEKVPTVEMVSANTDAVMFEVDEKYKKQTDDIIHKLEQDTGLEMEEDNIVRIVMANVNNYCELVQIGKDDFTVNYKGTNFEADSIIKNLKLIWNKDKKTWETSFTDAVKTNSMSIVGEALLRELLLDIPVEKTINECNDIFRFQIISHLGSTYEKCVQESPNGDIELQRNNRIYAGLKPSGAIIKVKANGRRDSLASQPPNLIIDNANKLTINDINKEWYIEIAKQRVKDFLGIKRLEDYKKNELLELANEYGLDIDKKIKKKDLIELIKKYKKGDVIVTKVELEEENKMLKEKLEKSMTQSEQLVEKIKDGGNTEMNEHVELNRKLYHKINDFRKEMRKREFIMDEELPSNLGGGEYASIGQLYDAVQEIALQVGLDFSFETYDLTRFDIDCTKPSGKLPIHVATVKNLIKLTDIDTGCYKEYEMVSQGSDTIDKAVGGATTLGFRNWLNKNFTPKANIGEDITTEEEKSQPPKIPTYIPEKKKEEIKKEVVKQEEIISSDDEDCKYVCENIMKIRSLTNNDTYGQSALDDIMSGKATMVDVEKMRQLTDSRLEELENV